MAGGTALEIIAILRNGEVLPNGDSTLQENDRMLLIASSNARSRLAEHLSPLAQPSPPERRVATTVPRIRGYAIS